MILNEIWKILYLYLGFINRIYMKTSCIYCWKLKNLTTEENKIANIARICMPFSLAAFIRPKYDVKMSV